MPRSRLPPPLPPETRTVVPGTARRDVFFAVTGGTGAYRDASGQARHIDTEVTDIIIDLDD